MIVVFDRAAGRETKVLRLRYLHLSDTMSSTGHEIVCAKNKRNVMAEPRRPPTQYEHQSSSTGGARPTVQSVHRSLCIKRIDTGAAAAYAIRTHVGRIDGASFNTARTDVLSNTSKCRALLLCCKSHSLAAKANSAARRRRTTDDHAQSGRATRTHHTPAWTGDLSTNTTTHSALRDGRLAIMRTINSYPPSFCAVPSTGASPMPQAQMAVARGRLLFEI